MGSAPRLTIWLLAVGLAAVARAQTQTAPPLVSVDLAPVAVATPNSAESPAAALASEDLAARSTWRLHVSAGAGWVASPGSSTGPSPSDLGGWLSVGKPLYEAERHRFYQWVTDTTILVGYSPANGRALLLMTPTFGTNFFLGPLFGLEWRIGGGFGATPSVRTNVGLGVLVEGAISLRPFSDDRRRIKLQVVDATVLGFLTTPMSPFGTVGFSAAFETQL